MTVGLRFSLGKEDIYSEPNRARDIDVAPGDPETVAVALNQSQTVQVWRHGVLVASQRDARSTVVEYSDSPGELYGLDTSSTGFYFTRMRMDKAGLSIVDQTQGLISDNFGDSMKFQDGRVYPTTGRVLDPSTLNLLGTYNYSGIGRVEPDSARLSVTRNSSPTRSMVNCRSVSFHSPHVAFPLYISRPFSFTVTITVIDLLST
jgi:hypothetical protein